MNRSHAAAASTVPLILHPAPRIRLLLLLAASLAGCAGASDNTPGADDLILFPDGNADSADASGPGDLLPGPENRPGDDASSPWGAGSSDASSDGAFVEASWPDSPVDSTVQDSADSSSDHSSLDSSPLDASADTPDMQVDSGQPDVCTPSCAGKQCGDDGCGGSCGACPGGQSCESGGCKPDPCVPQCAGKQCGDDGCGGICGGCGSNAQCQAGTCTCSFASCGSLCCAANGICLDDACRDCSHLVSLGDAGKNVAMLESCLSKWAIAALDSGTFPVAHGVMLPPGGQLLGNGPSHPVLELALPNQTNHLVTVADNGYLAHLTLDGMNSVLDANGAVVHVTGSNALVEDNIIRNKNPTPAGVHTTGIYFIGSQGKDSKAVANEIYNCFYGVIFAWMLDAAHPNTVEKNVIRDIRCDSITLAGYGRAVGNTIHNNGWDCENGPIPGGGIYCLQNVNGGEILDNDIYDNCGMNIDIDRCSGLVIKGNHAWNPGYQWEGWTPWCHGPASISLVDSSNFVVEGNVAENNDRPSNSFVGVPDWNGVFAKTGASAYSDLPSGSKQTIAFVLARRPGAQATAVGSTIKNNEFRSSCTPASKCVGLGYFASRNTGYSSGGDYLPNFYTGNNPFGSQIGSRRCGGNWYAADSVCNQGSPAPCNGDDYQHNPPVGDWARNDFCNWY